MTHDTASRRTFLRGVLAWPLVGLAPGARAAAGGPLLLATTPSCADADDLTPRETEGPYYKRSSPERTSLLDAGLGGAPIVVSGQVLSPSCQPVARALLDFWHADDDGEYDLAGYRLRGHQFTDGEGRYLLETIVPGRYYGRTRHIHVKVQPPSGPVLTTQLYFPGEAGNRSDGLYRPELEVRMQDAGGARKAGFDFVVRT